jgi:hypothetical protein
MLLESPTIHHKKTLLGCQNLLAKWLHVSKDFQMIGGLLAEKLLSIVKLAMPFRRRRLLQLLASWFPRYAALMFEISKHPWIKPSHLSVEMLLNQLIVEIASS